MHFLTALLRQGFAGVSCEEYDLDEGRISGKPSNRYVAAFDAER